MGLKLKSDNSKMEDNLKAKKKRVRISEARSNAQKLLKNQITGKLDPFRTMEVNKAMDELHEAVNDNENEEIDKEKFWLKKEIWDALIVQKNDSIRQGKTRFIIRYSLKVIKKSKEEYQVLSTTYTFYENINSRFILQAILNLVRLQTL